MPRALILVADGSEEIEFVTPYDGFEIQSVGVSLNNENYAHMTRNIRIVPDYAKLSSVPSPESYDILILPGGASGAKTFSTTNEVTQLIASFRSQAQKLATSSKTESAATRRAKVTSHPSVMEDIKMEGWEYREERVVVDGKVITSRGPGTAMLFALTIVETLVGKEKRDEISGPLMVAQTL
ncbi:hypothetical protein N0V87_009276 [Didymella glomerata]|uniref:D-lactate dehydratase n=1 Tax=Didymella glomerata TaxID=749621 RepID=A0A9W8WRG8_9PLEO|nr:hypothetical protein N0V87_009276 [Didymella glomerata]